MPTKPKQRLRKKASDVLSDNEKNFHAMTSRKLKTILIIAGVIIALVIVWIFWSGTEKVITNNSYYAVDKSGVEAKLRGIINSVQPNDKLLYENLNDIGCDSRNSVGLALYVHCEVVAQKYFESSGDISAGLDQILTVYSKNGWTFSGYANQARSIPNADSMSQSEGDYLISSNPLNQKVYSQVHVEFIGEDGKFETYRIKNLIEDGKIPQPAIGSKIYGLFVSETYWSCREDSFFEPRCPTPPSEPF